jgi:hypothetical protein
MGVLSIRDRNALDFRLLDLPPEIRNLIWQRVLVENNAIHLDTTSRSPHQPALTRTCRLIRNETLTWFYTRYRFIMEVFNYGITAGYSKISELGRKYGYICFLPLFRVGPCDISTRKANLLHWVEAVVIGADSGIEMVDDLDYIPQLLCHRLSKLFDNVHFVLEKQIDWTVAKEIL